MMQEKINKQEFILLKNKVQKIESELVLLNYAVENLILLVEGKSKNG